MSSTNEISLTQDLKGAYTRHKGIASGIAQVFDAGMDWLNDWRYQSEVKAKMRAIAPEIEGKLKSNLGVMLCLTFDKLEQTPGHYIPYLVSISIVGEGTNPQIVLNQAN